MVINKNDAIHVHLVLTDYGLKGSGTANKDGHSHVIVEDIPDDVAKHHVASFLHRITSTKELILMGWRKDLMPIGVVTNYDEHPFIKDVCVLGVYPRKEGIFYLSFKHSQLLSRIHRIGQPVN